MLHKFVGAGAPDAGSAPDLLAQLRTGSVEEVDVLRVAPQLDVAHGRPLAAADRSPTLQQEVGYINGLTPDGQINGTSFWGYNDETAFKWGAPTAGTGAKVTYYLDSASAFTKTEQLTIQKATEMWSSVADITFTRVKSATDANLFVTRGSDHNAYTESRETSGSGATLGQPTGQTKISIDTSVPGFDLSGSFDTYGGYGVGTIIHELGHFLGLGHSGPYNGSVNPATQQFSAFDDEMYSIMSYIYWGDTDAEYAGQNPYQGTNWGETKDGIDRQSAHSVMALDILAIQQLYGIAQHTPMSGGQTFGFHCNVKGDLHDFFDFTVNTSPVVTLFDEGTHNVLDLSGYKVAQTIDLHGGAFSSAGGLTNNVCIAYGTAIDAAIGGAGNDLMRANDDGDNLAGGGGNDRLVGGAGTDVLTGEGGNDKLFGGGGADIFFFAGKSGRDVIGDFARADTIRIDAKGVTSFADLTIRSDGKGGSLVSWAGGLVDVEHVAPGSLKSSAFAFGALSSAPASAHPPVVAEYAWLHPLEAHLALA